MAGTMVIYKGPLKDNTGKVVIAAGAEQKQTDVALEKMDYLVEGVVGKTRLTEPTMGVGVSVGASPVSPAGRGCAGACSAGRAGGGAPGGYRRTIESVAVPGAAIVAALVLFGVFVAVTGPQPAGRLPGDVPGRRSAPGSRSRTRCSAPRR